ncbi:acyl-CoA dehydrogenase family protein [Microseira wollei]|uniref:Acyl-CoA dehydrogenase n=1 Tax=Microseira wollei NIES-4236 TaxID=2530354 RepID=A0AAV3XEL4_9CYAN|nr:acyl-CoA dehydrogenase family protein [Microseira wollei]GET39285.1 acyl-CoA dehydrogenase [Microseira wollei NIES-4236]
MISCCSLGIAEAALESAISYTKKAQVAGVPLIELQSVHRQLVDMKAEINAARAIIWHVAWLKEKKQSARELVAIAKIHTTEMAVRIAQTAMNLHGGWGFSTEYDVERLLRDSQGSLAGGLAADVLRESITCSLFGINQWQPEPFNMDLF